MLSLLVAHLLYLFAILLTSRAGEDGRHEDIHEQLILKVVLNDHTKSVQP